MSTESDSPPHETPPAAANMAVPAAPLQLKGSASMEQLCQTAPPGLRPDMLPSENVGTDLLFPMGPPEPLPTLEPILLDHLHAQVWQEMQSASQDTFSHQGPATWLACLENASVLTWMMFVAHQSGQLVQEYFLNRPRLFAEVSRTFLETGADTLPVTREVEEEVILLGGPWCGAFYHWMNDFIPRLRLLLPELEARSQAPLKFLTLPPTRFQSETLELMGISSSQLLPFDRTAWRFRRLWVPSQMGHHMSTTPSNLRWLKSTLGQSSLRGGNVESPEKIYISRRDTERRRIINETALEQLLSRRGFVTLDGSQGTVQEQIRLFSRARVVVAAHGGALTHLSFAPPGALLIEIMPISHLTFPFYNIARCAGHSYIFLLSEPQNEHADFEADLGLLELILQN